MSRAKIGRLKKLVRLTELLHQQSISAVATLDREHDAITASLQAAQIAMDDAAYIGGTIPALFTECASRLVDRLQDAATRREAGIEAAAQSLSNINGLKRRMVEVTSSANRAAVASALDEAIEQVLRSKDVSLR